MNTEPEDPKIQSFKNAVSLIGAVVVCVIVGLVTIFAGTSLAVGAIVAIVGVVVINMVPVAARFAALARQQAMTKLSETFSEETIVKDEIDEGERIKTLGAQYKASRSNLEGAQEELRAQLATANSDERDMVQSQIDQIQAVIVNAEDTLKQRKLDYAELQRVNKLYIACNRAAVAMEKAGQSERNPEERRQLETSRNAIKTRMRSAMAGQTIAQMDQQIKLSSPRPQARIVGTSSMPRKSGS